MGKKKIVFRRENFVFSRTKFDEINQAIFKKEYYRVHDSSYKKVHQDGCRKS